MHSKRYTLPAGKSVRDLANALQVYLIKDEHMQVQVLPVETGQYVVQARAGGKNVAFLIGLDKAVRILLTPQENGAVDVAIGRGEWIRKSLTMATTAFVLWPVAITSMTGFLRQSKLTGRIDLAIQLFLTSSR